MKAWLKILVLSFLVVSCAKDDVDITGAPRAIPVKPAIEKLDKELVEAGKISRDIRDQARQADLKGLSPSSPESRRLVSAAESVVEKLEEATRSVSIVNERATALEKERDVYYNTSKKKSEDLDKARKDLTIAVERKRLWFRCFVAAGGILLLIILLKVAKLYGYSLNPSRLFLR